MLKEFTRLIYIVAPIPDTSDPTDEVFFIMTYNPSTHRGLWWPAVLPLP